MNLKIIPSKNIKFIKLCIVSPLFEILTNVVYLVSFFLLAFRVLAMGSFFSNFQLNTLLSNYFDETYFRTISTEEHFLDYLDNIMKKLSNYSPISSVPIMIPFGAVRLKKYANDPDLCQDKIDFTKVCTSSSCTIEELKDIYEDSKCGYINKKGVRYDPDDSNEYDSGYLKLVRPFEGKYSEYNLVSQGENYDFTIDEYITNLNDIKNFIHDYEAKFIAIEINVYFPVSNVYGLVLAGIEMANYFTFPYQIFTSTIYSEFKVHNAYFLTSYVIFCVAVALNIIKLLYELNVKFSCITHSFILVNECLNLLLIIFVGFYFSSIREEEFFDEFMLSHTFHEHYVSISLKSYTIVIIAILFICIPFRFLSFLSWFQKVSFYLVKYAGIIFRILPGMLIFFIYILFIFLMFGLMNFFVYNSLFLKMENLFKAWVMSFNFNSMYQMNNSRELLYDIAYSDYFLLYNVLQILIILIALCVMVGTVVLLIQKSLKYETEKEEDEVIQKISEIEMKLAQEILKYDENYKRMKKQILWLNLNDKNDLFLSYAPHYNMILFTKSNQVISFLKYLFALKPEMQFKNLTNKVGVIIETKIIRNEIKGQELEQIEMLLDWLKHVGCKIPIALYTPEIIERNLKMKISTIYIMLKFIGNKDEILTFVKDLETVNKDDTNNSIQKINKLYQKCNLSNFTIYPSNAVGETKTKKLVVTTETNSNNNDYQINIGDESIASNSSDTLIKKNSNKDDKENKEKKVSKFKQSIKNMFVGSSSNNSINNNVSPVLSPSLSAIPEKEKKVKLPLINQSISEEHSRINEESERSSLT